MWKCKGCSEQIENNFDACWKCGHSRSGGLSKGGDVDSRDMLLPNGQLISQVVENNISSGSGNSELPSLQQVVIVDINMPFFSMVTFMVKWAIAAIPALLILYLMGVILTFIGLGVTISKL